MTRTVFRAALVLAALTPAAAFAQHAAQAPDRLFKQRCGACHQSDNARNGVGPSLQGVVGRTAGTVAGYNYSPSMKSSGITWTAETMDAFLANPTATVRGTKMAQRFNNADERKAIIDYLATH
jgi:cytochrome c